MSERIKKLRQSKTDAAPKVVAVKKPKPPKKPEQEVPKIVEPEPPKTVEQPPTAETAKILYKCGHEVIIPEIVVQRCGKCKNQHFRARKEKRHGPEKFTNIQKRLPHGSTFTKVFDATTNIWTETLTVPQDGSETLQFTTQGGNSFRAEADAFAMYCQWAEAKTGVATATPSE